MAFEQTLELEKGLADATALELRRLAKDLGAVLAALSGNERYLIEWEFARLVLASIDAIEAEARGCIVGRGYCTQSVITTQPVAARAE